MAATPTSVKIRPFGAENGTPVDIPTDAPSELNKLEAWTDDTQGIISGIQFTYTDPTQDSPIEVTFGAGGGPHGHVLFDTAQNPQDYVVNLYGYADTNVVHKLGIRSHAGADNSRGEDIGNSFEIPVARGSIVAFFGLSDGDALNAVGAYVAP